MKRTDIAKLRSTPDEDLIKSVDELRLQMLKSRIAKAVESKGIGPKYRTLRRQIARIQTLIGERHRAASKAQS